MIPKTYFSTPLSKSAKDTEGRICNILRGSAAVPLRLRWRSSPLLRYCAAR